MPGPERLLIVAAFWFLRVFFMLTRDWPVGRNFVNIAEAFLKLVFFSFLLPLLHLWALESVVTTVDVHRDAFLIRPVTAEVYIRSMAGGRILLVCAGRGLAVHLEQDLPALVVLQEAVDAVKENAGELFLLVNVRQIVTKELSIPEVHGDNRELRILFVV